MHQPYWNCNQLWSDILDKGFDNLQDHLKNIEDRDELTKQKSALWLMDMDYSMIYDVELESDLEANIGAYAKISTHYDVVFLDRPNLTLVVNGDIVSSIIEFMYKHLGVTSIKYKTLEINKWYIGKNGRQHKST